MATSEKESADKVRDTEAAAKITKPAAEAAEEKEAKNPDKTRPDDSADEEQTPAKKVKPGKNFDVLDRFLQLSGYKKADVLDHNDSRRTVVTSNGGKYQLSPKGSQVRKLAGPDTPAALAAAEEDEEDE